MELSEAITDWHNVRNLGPTYQRGYNKIDGIFISHNVTIQKAGYLPFGYFPLDHRGIWIDLKHSQLLGFQLNPIIQPQVRRLKTNDPHVLKKWQQLYTHHLIANKLTEQQFKLEASITSQKLN